MRRERPAGGGDSLECAGTRTRIANRIDRPGAIGPTERQLRTYAWFCLIPNPSVYAGHVRPKWNRRLLRLVRTTVYESQLPARAVSDGSETCLPLMTSGGRETIDARSGSAELGGPCGTNGVNLDAPKMESDPAPPLHIGTGSP